MDGWVKGMNESRERFDCGKGFDVLWFRISPWRWAIIKAAYSLQCSHYPTRSSSNNTSIGVSMQRTHLWNRGGRTSLRSARTWEYSFSGTDSRFLFRHAIDYPLAVERAGQGCSSSLERRSITQPEICCFSRSTPKDRGHPNLHVNS